MRGPICEWDEHEYAMLPALFTPSKLKFHYLVSSDLPSSFSELALEANSLSSLYMVGKLK